MDKKIAKASVDENVNKKINKLSKGMLSMVTITVALASKAEFTFMDEPVAGVDVVMREQFYRVLLEEFAESGRTFVISTHIIEEASDVFEEVIMLDKPISSEVEFSLAEPNVFMLDMAEWKIDDGEWNEKETIPLNLN